MFEHFNLPIFQNCTTTQLERTSKSEQFLPLTFRRILLLFKSTHFKKCEQFKNYNFPTITQLANMNIYKFQMPLQSNNLSNIKKIQI